MEHGFFRFRRGHAHYPNGVTSFSPVLVLHARFTVGKFSTSGKVAINARAANAETTSAVSDRVVFKCRGLWSHYRGTICGKSTYPIPDVGYPALFDRLRSAFSGSPWERLPMYVPIAAFGPGSRRQFSHYFAGESHVAVSSIDDIVAWLGTCEYASDLEQFHRRPPRVR